MEKRYKSRNPHNESINFINHLAIQPVNYLTDTETAGLPLRSRQFGFFISKYQTFQRWILRRQKHWYLLRVSFRRPVPFSGMRFALTCIPVGFGMKAYLRYMSWMTQTENTDLMQGGWCNPSTPNSSMFMPDFKFFLQTLILPRWSWVFNYLNFAL